MNTCKSVKVRARVKVTVRVRVRARVKVTVRVGICCYVSRILPSLPKP